MSVWRWVFFPFLFFCVSSSATVSVAFFEMYDHRQQRVELEKGGRFYHVAISTEAGWLHVSPKDGVELFESLDQVALKTVVLTDETRPTLSLQDIAPYLNLPFDYGYRWNSKNSTYCSKLVANLLKIKPLPMTFESSHWKWAQLPSRRGKGLSPDDLYAALKGRKNFKEQTACSRWLHPPSPPSF
jgi:hypothetical protein